MSYFISRHLSIVGLMLAHRLRRWPNIDPTMGEIFWYICQPANLQPSCYNLT